MKKNKINCFLKFQKLLTYLIINKQIDIEDCSKIKKIFENAGWKNVRCDQEHNDSSGSYKVVTFLKLEA